MWAFLVPKMFEKINGTNNHFFLPQCTQNGDAMEVDKNTVQFSCSLFSSIGKRMPHQYFHNLFSKNIIFHPISAFVLFACGAEQSSGKSKWDGKKNMVEKAKGYFHEKIHEKLVLRRNLTLTTIFV